MKREVKMIHFNITVPDTVKREMTKHSEINWSAVATKAFEKQLKAQKILEQFADSSVAEEDAIQRGLKIHHRQGKTLSQRVR
jgi:hypothetical protein